jgi:hypothetical protein
VATDEVREGEIGRLYDEIENLVEPIERPDMDVRAGPQRDRMSERRGQSHAFDSPVPGEGTDTLMPMAGEKAVGERHGSGKICGRRLESGQ